MKQHSLILGAAIAAAMAGSPGLLQAQSVNAGSGSAGISVREAQRVTHTVTNSVLVTIPDTHPQGLAARAASRKSLPESTAMNHLQLILKSSAARAAQMAISITNQHDPKSVQFHHWLTPRQFGDAFGVVDGDIAAVTSWLTSEGFTVNGVYPNKMQIDFSGTASQVNQAFHTQENVYELRDGTHLIANSGDVSVPAALQPVISGVLGLSEAPAAKTSKPDVATWNPTTRRFDLTGAAAARAHAMAVGPGGLNGTRGLVPNDLAKMYGISTIRHNGVTGKGITIAIVEYGPTLSADWSNFVGQFGLGGFGGTFSQVTPQVGNLDNCYDGGPPSDPPSDDYASAEDMEAATAIAPGANIEVAYCASYTSTYAPATSNAYGGIFIATTNLVNGDDRPDIVSINDAGYEVDSASKTAVDLLTAQADAEGISVFATTGDSGTNSDGIEGVGPTVAAMASSPYVTAVGGTDLADELDGTTSQYFSSTPNAVYGTALGYVPEIPWNASCGNGVVAKADGFHSAVSFCQFLMAHDPNAVYTTSIGTGSGSSLVNRKPAWQRLVYNAAKDQSRDVPDVSLFGGSYGGDTGMIICAQYNECTPNFATPIILLTTHSLATPMFAGVQALIDQGLAMRGLPADQGNAAPTLYAIARQEYGGPTGPTPASLAACNADNGDNGTANCVFHNITRGSSSVNCDSFGSGNTPPANAPNCYVYGTVDPYGYGLEAEGLTTIDVAPTTYGVSNKAYGAQPGWSFASGLGSVNVTNLLIAWRAFDHAPAATPQ